MPAPVADYVWLPLRFDGAMPIIEWYDEWRVEDVCKPGRLRGQRDSMIGGPSPGLRSRAAKGNHGTHRDHLG